MKQHFPEGGIGSASGEIVLEGSENIYDWTESEILTLGENNTLLVSEILKPSFEDDTKDVRARGALREGYSRCS